MTPQCTPDLSQENCSTYLDDVISDLRIFYGKVGGLVYTTTCIIRYEVYNFYGPTIDLQLTSSPPLPSPQLPPATTSSSSSEGKSNKSRTTNAVIVPVVVFLVALIICIPVYLRRRKARKFFKGKKILKRLRCEQEKLFKKPFDNKTKQDNFSEGSYRWGSPTAKSITQLSWSEAFHIPLTDILHSNASSNSLSSTIEQFATTVSRLAQTLADILAEKMGHKSTFFKENCLPNTCYLRLNRYPPCPIASEIHGLMPHTDSDFLTILYQDQVGGLQLVKDMKWIAVKPNPDALIINIGDLFQAWSSGVYKSVEHRVVTNPKVERFSAAYFLYPSNDTVIESCIEPSVYRKFSFQEYRKQVRDDVQKLGSKVGLPRFLTHA